MATTLVIVELLIIGFQVLLWVGLLLCVLLGKEWADVEKLKEWEAWIPLLGVGIFAAAYTAGLLFDRLVGNVSTICQAKLGRPQVPREQKILRWMIVMNRHEAWGDIEGLSRQIRLLRATCVNAFFIAIVALIWHRHYLEIALLALAVIAGYTWYVSRKRADEAWDIVSEAYRRLEGRNTNGLTDDSPITDVGLTDTRRRDEESPCD